MKLNKIRSLCKERGRCYLFDEFRPESGELVRQWLSDGTGLWPVSGLPVLQERNLGTLLGLNEKQAEKWTIQERELPEDLYAATGDLMAGESQVKESFLSLSISGRELLPVPCAGGGVLWVDRARLEPCWSRQTILAARETDTRQILAVFDGLLLAGILLPEPIPEDVRRELRRVSL